MNEMTLTREEHREIEPYRHAFLKCLDFVRSRNFRSYDLYDGINSRHSLIRDGKWPGLLSTYFNKFSPINLRRILGIEASRQNYALATIGQALLRFRGELSGRNELIRTFKEEFEKTTLRKVYGYDSWDGHGFPLRMWRNSRPVGMTGIVGNEAVGQFLLEYFKEENDHDVIPMLRSARDFMLNELFTRWNESPHFRYTPATPNWVWTYNASAIGCRFVLRVGHFLGDERGRKEAESALTAIIRNQKPDGSWLYSMNLKTGVEKDQIDFHQGFIIDSLIDYMEVYGERADFVESVGRGLLFYRRRLFSEEGRGVYRYPRKWPINIHNQSQGILTFARAGRWSQDYLAFSKSIADWTIKHMQDSDGHFYSFRYPFCVNKIPYIRWSDANMLNALTVLMDSIESLSTDSGA